MESAYREFQVRGLTAQVVCVWDHLPVTDHVQLVVPDGCIDLIWFGESRLLVAGADTGPRLIESTGGRWTSGVRLRTAAGGSFLGRPASDIRDQLVDAEAVLGPPALRLSNRLHHAAPRERLRLLMTAVADRDVDADPLVQASIGGLARPGARVAAVAAELGVSERQLNRRTVNAVGYGPKMLARVARLRRLTTVPERDLALRALDAGYASQSHMSDEVRRLTGLTAVRFLEDWAPASP